MKTTPIKFIGLSVMNVPELYDEFLKAERLYPMFLNENMQHEAEIQKEKMQTIKNLMPNAKCKKSIFQIDKETRADGTTFTFALNNALKMKNLIKPKRAENRVIVWNDIESKVEFH
jgi:hypothetical protein